jgi:hypothetical protein
MAGKEALEQLVVGEVAPFAAQFVAEMVSWRATRPELKVLAGLAMPAVKPPNAVPVTSTSREARTAGIHCLQCLKKRAAPLFNLSEKVVFVTVNWPLCLSVTV